MSMKKIKRKKHNKIKVRKGMRKVQIEKGTKNNLTINAGLIPIIQYMHKIGFTLMFGREVDHERGLNARYLLTDVVELTILGLIAGVSTICGIATIWADPVLRKIGGWLSTPHETTLGRIYKTVTCKQVYELQVLNHKLRIREWARLIKSGNKLKSASNELWIDIDSTVKVVYGHQEGAEKGYNPENRGKRSYHPLLAFCGETKEILQGWLRPGNTYTSNGTVEFLKELFGYVNNPIKTLVRGDSGFFDGDLFEYLEGRRKGYLIKVKLKGLKELLSKQEWKPVKGVIGFEETSFSYKCEKWKKERSFVAVRKVKEKESKNQLDFFEKKDYEYFCYVLTEEYTPWEAHKKYGERATCETWIEEAKNQMGLGHIKTSDFWANALIFQSAIMAYNIVRWMALLSGDKKMISWEIKTIRMFLIRVAGMLIETGRQLKLLNPVKLLYENQWKRWCELGV